MTDDRPWFGFIRAEDLGERHTGLTARVGPLEGGDPVVGPYEDRGDKFLVDGAKFSKNDFDIVQIESDADDGPEEVHD